MTTPPIRELALIAGFIMFIGILLGGVIARLNPEPGLTALCKESIQFISNDDFIMYCSPRSLSDPPPEAPNNGKK